MFWYIVFFAMTVIIFGIVYTKLTPMGEGIGQNLQQHSDITYATGIYFSIVTISSLGYGDMHPMGWSKVLACIEVLLGLALIGIMIAKVTSRRMSYHVERLFSSDAQKRLEAIAAEFETSQDYLTKIMPDLENAYQSTPGATSPSTEDKTALIARFRQIVSDLRSRCLDLHDYFSDEIAQGNYFQIAPTNAIVRVADAVDGVFFQLGQLVISLSSLARSEILDQRTRQGISEAIDDQTKVCELVDQHTGENIRSVFQSIRNTCNQLPESYWAVPETSQPDQILQGTDQPQQISGDNEQTDFP